MVYMCGWCPCITGWCVDVMWIELSVCRRLKGADQGGEVVACFVAEVGVVVVWG